MTSPPKGGTSSDANDGNRNENSPEVQGHFTMPMEVFRELYKTEIHLLWREVEHFRSLCQQQMAKHRSILKEHRIHCEEALEAQQRKYSAPDLPNDISQELRQLEENMTFLESDVHLKTSQRRVTANVDATSDVLTQKIQTQPSTDDTNRTEENTTMLEAAPVKIDSGEASETSHVTESSAMKEETTSKSSEDTLKEELRRSLKHLESIDSEATSYDIPDETLNDTAANSKETSNKARKHWMLARKHLIDKMALLEATVKRYRSELAAATTKITAKEMEVTQLNKQMSELRSDIKKKDRKIDELEDRLMNTLADKTRSERNLEMFMEELQNIELHTTIAIEDETDPVQPPIKQQTSFKKKLLRKQHSSMSFFGPSKDKNSKSHLGGATSPSHSGDITPECESPQLKRRSSHPPILEDINGDASNDVTTKQLLSEILDKGRGANKGEQTILKKHYGVDTSSRACAVM